MNDLQSIADHDPLYKPTCYKDVILCTDSALLKRTIQKEYDSPFFNKTWSLSEVLPGRTTIKSRWMFKVKPGVNGSEPRYKACLVAKWFLQKFGIDNGETYSPVPKFCYATCHSIHREGFTIPGQENSVCRLHKSLYRLKRVWHFWNRNFDTFIKKF